MPLEDGEVTTSPSSSSYEGGKGNYGEDNTQIISNSQSSQSVVEPAATIELKTKALCTFETSTDGEAYIH